MSALHRGRKLTCKEMFARDFDLTLGEGSVRGLIGPCMYAENNVKIF